MFLAVQAKLETLDAAGSLCTTGEIFLGPLRMTEGELLALLVARRALQQYQGTPFHHQLEVAFEKLAGGLKDRISFSPADELQAVSFKSIGVGKANFQMRLYSLIPLWFIYYEGGPRCGSLLIKPRLDPADLSHVDRPKDMGETANWPGMRHYDVDLGHPIAVVDLDVLKSQEATDAVRKNIRRAAKYARTCQVHYHLGIPYFHWIAVTQPDGKSFYPAFAQFPIPPTAEARVQIMQQLAPSLISFALHYKEVNDVESLAAIRRLIREVLREFPLWPFCGLMYVRRFPRPAGASPSSNAGAGPRSSH